MISALVPMFYLAAYGFINLSFFLESWANPDFQPTFKVKKWIAYHGFSININNDISNYKKIIPCGIKDKGVTTLKKIDNQNYNKLSKEIIKNLLTSLKI